MCVFGRQLSKEMTLDADMLVVYLDPLRLTFVGQGHRSKLKVTGGIFLSSAESEVNLENPFRQHGGTADVRLETANT